MNDNTLLGMTDLRSNVVAHPVRIAGGEATVVPTTRSYDELIAFSLFSAKTGTVRNNAYRFLFLDEPLVAPNGERFTFDEWREATVHSPNFDDDQAAALQEIDAVREKVGKKLRRRHSLLFTGFEFRRGRRRSLRFQGFEPRRLDYPDVRRVA